MSNNQKFFAGLLLGAAAGAALVLFLTSEKGKSLLKEVREDADDLQKDMKSQWQEFDTAVTDLLQKGKSFIEELEGKVKGSQ